MTKDGSATFIIIKFFLVKLNFQFYSSLIYCDKNLLTILGLRIGENHCLDKITNCKILITKN